MKTAKMEMELDRISSLPTDVIENILSRLPLREAVRTSVLSSKWRYKSAMLEYVEFDECEWRSQNRRVSDDDDQIQDPVPFVNMVDHVLLLRISPIRKIKLFCDEVAHKHIDRWLTHLSRNSLKELSFRPWLHDHDQYNIPLCLFSCQELVRLNLIRCSFKPPSQFRGFRNLKGLRLASVTVAQDVLDNLIGGCPLLERLIVRACDGITSLKIDAPNLQYLNVLGAFDVVNLKNALNITEAIIGMTIPDDQIEVPGGWVPARRSSNLLNIFDHLPHIRKLTIVARFLEYLSLGASPEKLPEPFQYLKVLYINLCFADPDAIATALCLLRSSPALQELQIWASSNRKLKRVGQVKSCLRDNNNFTFSQLRLVKITEFSAISGVKPVLDFIRFLLLNSPALERMTVQACGPMLVFDFARLATELLQFKRDSKRAEIILENPFSHCFSSPLLEILGLRHCDGFTNLKIDAPNLRIIDIIGVFEDVNLENTSNLAQVSIEWTENVDQRQGPASSGNLLNFFDRQPHIQRLTINRNFLKYLSIGALPEKLPKPCHYLNFLSVHMSFDVRDEILAVLCLLRSSPALQELDISVDTEKDHAAVGEVKSCLYDSYNCAYTQLRLVKITDISGVKAELDFIKFRLLSSPALERMTVKPSVNCSSELVKELLRFRRLSMLAEIIYLDP